MRTTLLFLLSILFLSTSFAQKEKVKIKKDIVYIDDVPQFKMEYTVRTNTITILNLDDKKIAIFRALSYNDESARTGGNPDGSINYYDVTFLNEDTDKCEAPNNGLKKALALDIIDNNLIENGELNETAVKLFVKINGSKFSEAKSRSTTVIIINK